MIASTISRPRTSTGSHLKLPGASGAFVLYGHQKRGIWRIIARGSTYLAHAVGAGKTMTMAAAIMEQRRLGLIAKAMLVVPGHCLAQAAREFLGALSDRAHPRRRRDQLHQGQAAPLPVARCHRHLGRDHHHAFGASASSPCHRRFEQQMIQDELELYETLLTKVESDDRVSRKRLERLKEGLKERLEALVHPQGRSAHHLRDRRRPDHRRRGAGVPQALLRHQHVDV